jgi:drug/metabolite transporter (DMT)-like permease
MVELNKKENLLGQGMLLLATFIWGTSFTVLKDTLSGLPVLFVLAIRFLISALIIFLVFFKRFKNIKKRTILVGLLLGAILTIAYILQTYGLIGVSPGENAFLTSTYVVMTPFLCWFIFKKRPDVYSVIAGTICIVGIAFVALFGTGGLSIGLGQILTLLCAVFYCLQILVISNLCSNEDSLVILCIQLAVVGLVCGTGSLIFEVGKADFSLNLEEILKLCYLCFACTLLAQGLQIMGQKKVTNPSQASLTLSLESVFGLTFSLILGGESLTVYSIIGFVLIFIAVVISETKLEFIRKLFKKSEN